MQSPVDLDIRLANGADLGPIRLDNLFNTSTTTLHNISDTVQLTFDHDSYLSGGPLLAKYKFHNMLLHWGRNDEEGTEHTLQGKRLALEAHFVFKYDYKFKAPVEILESHRKLADLKWKVEHPDEEEEEEDEDEDYVEEEEEETEEEMLERYDRDTKNFEILQKNKMDEWGEKRRQIIENDKNKDMIQKSAKSEKVETKKEAMGKAKPVTAEERPAWADSWDAIKGEVIKAGIVLQEHEWVSLREKYAVSKDAADIVRAAATSARKKFGRLPPPPPPSQRPVAEELSADEKNLSKARKLETETMLRMELACLEKCKADYVEWIKGEDQLDKKLKRELRENFEAYLEELEERDELEDDADIPEEEKRKTRIRWTIMDNKKEQAVKDKLKGVINRRKKDLDSIRTKEIKSLAVIALLFKAENAAPPFSLFSFLTHVREPFQQIQIDGNLLAQFRNGLCTGDYFTYSGSLTMSPYSENVTWICMRDPLPILPAQVEFLRHMKSEWGEMSQNCRDTQALGNRQLYFNQKAVAVQQPACPGKELCCDKNMPKEDWSKFI